MFETTNQTCMLKTVQCETYCVYDDYDVGKLSVCVCVQNCLGLIPIPGNVRVFTVGFHLTHAIHGTGCISQRQKGRGQEEIASAREERERGA